MPFLAGGRSIGCDSLGTASKVPIPSIQPIPSCEIDEVLLEAIYEGGVAVDLAYDEIQRWDGQAPVFNQSRMDGFISSVIPSAAAPVR